MSGIKTLWLHVGIPKTSTTAFQAWMRDHSDALKKRGLIYPPLFGAGNDKHNFLVGDLRRGSDLGTLEALLSETHAPSILLSDEGLSNHLDDFDAEALARFQNLTRDIEVKIILVTREAESWIRSYHKQCVLNPNNGASPLWGTGLSVSEISSHPRIERLLDTKKLAQDLATAFGAADVHKFEYENENWFQTSLKTMGVTMSDAAFLPQTNQSLPDWAIEILRRVNLLTEDRSDRTAWKRALQAYLQTNHTILTNLLDGKTVSVDQDSLSKISADISSIHPQLRKDALEFLNALS